MTAQITRIESATSTATANPLEVAQANSNAIAALADAAQLLGRAVDWDAFSTRTESDYRVEGNTLFIAEANLVDPASLEEPIPDPEA